MPKANSYVCICDESVEDALITVYMAFGVKGTGRLCRVLYGTGEIDTVLQNRKRKQLYKDSIKYRWQTKS